jgi:hypothetical protein
LVSVGQEIVLDGMIPKGYEIIAIPMDDGVITCGGDPVAAVGGLQVHFGESLKFSIFKINPVG